MCVCVCVIEVLWKAALKGKNEGGADKTWLPKEHTNTIHSLSHTLTGIRDASDRDVTSLPSSLLFGPQSCGPPNGLLFGRVSASFQTFPSAHGDFQKAETLQDYFLAEWDLDLIRV